MVKNAFFFEKMYKKSPQRRGIRPRNPVGLRRLEAPPPDRCIVTLAYYYTFVKFIFSTKCGLLSLNEKQFLLLPNVAPIFHFCSFVDRGLNSVVLLTEGSRIFLGAGYPTYATGGKSFYCFLFSNP